MATSHTPADDIVYNLVSIQYHALQAAQLYDQYAKDAEGHEDVQEFIRACQENDAWRATRCHELLRELTKGHGLSGS
jgi:rubrerythrin